MDLTMWQNDSQKKTAIKRLPYKIKIPTHKKKSLHRNPSAEIPVLLECTADYHDLSMQKASKTTMDQQSN